MSRIFSTVLFFVLGSIALLCPNSGRASADCSTMATDCVPRISTVYDVHNTDLSGSDYTSFYLVSYGSSTISSVVTLGDGAAGLFVRGNAVGTSPCSSTSDNGGSILIDKGNPGPGKHCFYRQNVSGDLRQWGLIAGSTYDALYEVHNNTPNLIQDAQPRIAAALAALSTNPPTQSEILTLHTRGVSLKIGAPLQMPPGTSLTCDTPPVKDATFANFTSLPGSIVLGNGALLDALTNTNDVEISKSRSWKFGFRLKDMALSGV